MRERVSECGQTNLICTSDRAIQSGQLCIQCAPRWQKCPAFAFKKSRSNLKNLGVCACKKNNKRSPNPQDACFRHPEEVCAGRGFNFMVGHREMFCFAQPWCGTQGSRCPLTSLLTANAVDMNSPVPSQRQQGLTRLMLECPQTSRLRFWLQLRRLDNED